MESNCRDADQSANSSQPSSLNNEISVLKTLNHPYIVKYHDSFIEKDQICIVMDFCEKGDLHGKVKKAQEQDRIFDPSQILDWFCQLAIGLEHIHNMKVLHRDLKTSNVLLTRDNTVKIGDFGISKPLEYTE
jgi:serine/threonine protein kinase